MAWAPPPRWRVLAIVCVAALAPAFAHALDVRAFAATHRILDRGGLPAGAATVSLAASRDEYEGFQLLVVADAGEAQALNMTLSDLSGPNGAQIPGASAEFYRERYVHVTTPSFCNYPFNTQCDAHPEYNRVAGDFPEQLVPFRDPYGSNAAVAAPFDVTPNSFAVVFVDLHVPKDAASGDYAATLTITSAAKPVATVPVHLHVWHFTMPAKRSIATAYGFSEGSIRRYHGGPNGPDDKAYAQLARNYELEVHRHRIDYTTYNPGLNFQFAADGTLLPIDFAAYDAFLAPRIDGSLFPDGAGLNRFNLGMFGPGNGTGGLSDAQFSAVTAAVATHLQAKGWLSHVYLYSTDEPFSISNPGAFDRIAADSKLLHKNTDLWHGHVLATSPWFPQLDGLIDIWCPVTSMYGDGLWADGSFPGHEKYVGEFAKGRELWFYVCNADFPPELGYDTDSPLGFEPRLVKWGAWAEGATGFLFWEMSYWQDPTPWDTLANPAQFGAALSRNGDGILLFPGDHNGTAGGAGSPANVAINGPVVSIRLKQIRDGLEDWEMLRLADSLGGGAFARKQVARVYTRFGARLDDNYTPAQRPWETDDAVLLDARVKIARKIEFLQDPTQYPDPEASTPTVADAGTTDTTAPLDDVAAPSAAPPHAPGCSTAHVGPATSPDAWLAWALAILAARLCAGRARPVRRNSERSSDVD